MVGNAKAGKLCSFPALIIRFPVLMNDIDIRLRGAYFRHDILHIVEIHLAEQCGRYDQHTEYPVGSFCARNKPGIGVTVEEQGKSCTREIERVNIGAAVIEEGLRQGFPVIISLVVFAFQDKAYHFVTAGNGRAKVKIGRIIVSGSKSGRYLVHLTDESVGAGRSRRANRSFTCLKKKCSGYKSKK